MSEVPELRFPKYTDAWGSKRLGDYAKMIGGFAFSSFRMSRTKAKFQLVKMSNLYQGVLDLGRNSSYLDEIVEKERKYIIEHQDILMSLTGTVGKRDFGYTVILKNPVNLLLNQRVGLLRTSPSRSEALFIYNLTKTHGFNKKFHHTAVGGTGNQANVSTLDCDKILICIPSLPEQKKIADFLGAVDEKVRLLRARHDHLKTYKTGVMQKIFAQDIRFKTDDGSDFPDWQRKRLSEVAKRSTEKNKYNEHKRVLTNSAVQGVVDQSAYFDKDIANVNNLDGYYIVKKGDFVYNPRISSTAPVGPIKRNHLGDGVMSPLYSVFRFDNDDVQFYEQYFETTHWHKYMKSVANYGARHDRMAISTADFLGMPLPAPCAEEQQKIADFLSAIDDKISAVSVQIDQMQDFKKGLLQQMFV